MYSGKWEIKKEIVVEEAIAKTIGNEKIIKTIRRIINNHIYSFTCLKNSFIEWIIQIKAHKGKEVNGIA